MRGWSSIFARLIPILWLGAGLAISFVAIPVVFSPAIKSALPAKEVGHVAQSILARFFLIQLGLLGAELAACWGAGWFWTKFDRLAWGTMAMGALIAACWFHPKLMELHRLKYDPAQPALIQETAARDFRHWHGLSQAGNLGMLGLLAALAVRNLVRTEKSGKR